MVGCARQIVSYSVQPAKMEEILEISAPCNSIPLGESLKNILKNEDHLRSLQSRNSGDPDCKSQRYALTYHTESGCGGRQNEDCFKHMG